MAIQRNRGLSKSGISVLCAPLSMSVGSLRLLRNHLNLACGNSSLLTPSAITMTVRQFKGIEVTAGLLGFENSQNDYQVTMRLLLLQSFIVDLYL
jgi:hypothetical protein